MPLKLLSPGGGSVLLQANTTSLDYTLTVPAETANLITTATSSGINASALTIGTVPTGNLPTIPAAKLPTGSILQVVQTVKSDRQYITGARVWQAVSGLSASITPSSSSNKIMISVTMHASGDGSYDSAFRITKNGSALSGALATNYGSRLIATFSAGVRASYESNFCGINYLDSPATTSSTTYAIECSPQDGTYINADKYAISNDNQYAECVISTITLWEIVA